MLINLAWFEYFLNDPVSDVRDVSLWALEKQPKIFFMWLGPVIFFKISLAFWPILYAGFFASEQKYC